MEINMLFHQITPFVRYAYKYYLNPSDKLVSSIDCRLFYIHNGNGYIEVDSKKYQFSQNTLFFWQAGTRYKIICETPTQLTSVNFDLTDERMNLTEPFSTVEIKEQITVNVPRINFEDYPCLNDCIVLKNCESLEKKFRSIVAETVESNLLNREKSSALLKGLLVDIVRLYNQSSLSSKTDKDLRIVLDYIHHHFKENIDNSTLAELVNYHPYYLNRLMLSRKKITLHQYLINHRIYVSENLLLFTDMPISKIAQESGFSSGISFTENFKKKNGITPREFRKRLYITD